MGNSVQTVVAQNCEECPQALQAEKDSASGSQEDDANELLFEELRDTSKSTALVFMRDFNLPEINWEHHTTGTTQARRFLKHLDDNFMVLRESTQKDVLLDLLFVNRAELMGKVEIGGSLGHSNHEAEFKISVGRMKSASKTSTLDMRRAYFRLLRELVSKVILEKGEPVEHLQYIDYIIVWGSTAEEVFEKEKIIQILLKAGFAIKGPAGEIKFLEVK
ncbi:dtw domain-containing protein 2 [Pitangus sulphuratus]|nr:dtw domain-containing protein 2 [Pitangus sulphuratus]